MTLKDYVLSKIQPEVYYKKRFPEWNQYTKHNVQCCFHDDRSPSLALNLNNGGAKCHASSCGLSFGNIVHFESCCKKLKESLVVRRLYREFIRPIVSVKTVQKFKDALFGDSIWILRIRKEMGLDFPSIRKYSLGLDSESKRIVIPIYDQFGLCINLRFYKLPSQRNGSSEIKIYNLKGYGKLDLFPNQDIQKFPIGEPVFFMASEKEAMLANQLGMRAFCTTTGEGSWSSDWNSMIMDRPVNIIFDRDRGGIEAAKRIKQHLASIAKPNIIELPFNHSRKDFKDFADWILREKHKIREIKALANLKRSQPKTCPERKSPQPELPDFAVEEIQELSSISRSNRYLNLRIRTEGIVAAKATNTYSIPWQFDVEPAGQKHFIYSMEMGRDLLRFVRASDSAILQSVQNLVGQTDVKITPRRHLTATEVEVIPTAAVDRDSPYVIQRCFHIGRSIESNVPYYLEVIPTSEIRSQETVGIITKAEPTASTIEKFVLTPEIIADLSAFAVESGQGVWVKLEEIADTLSKNYTRIYNRLDWHLVALLTWGSPLGWKFPGESEQQRGWINSLAIGDTETGKSKVCRVFRQIFNCGVLVNAENCTYVGLVGGCIKMGSGQLMLRWGRIPLCDKQLVVIEELSGLSCSEIANMSDVRSSGVARLDKGGINSETNARTRIICLSNVRGSRKNLSGYLYGVQAIQELVGQPEDIARFDLITTLVDAEVSVQRINSEKTFASNANYGVDQFKTLIQFIWSLSAEQIEFTQSAYHECLYQTKLLADIYHASIPIFKGGSGRYKIGRIAAAIACVCFNWSGERRRIIVSKNHVLAAVRLMQSIYDKASFGYLEYSKRMFDRERVKDTIVLRKAFSRIHSSRLGKVVEALIHSTRFTREEFAAIAGISTPIADQLIGAMVRERALRKGEANLWDITPAGKKWMETLL